MAKKIINVDLEVTGKASVSSVANEAGDFLTHNGLSEVTKRTAAEVLTDIGAAATGHQHTFAHNQGVASSVWNVNHGLSKYPSVTVVDSAGTIVVGKIDFTDNNNVIITFNASFSGDAYFN